MTRLYITVGQVENDTAQETILLSGEEANLIRTFLVDASYPLEDGQETTINRFAEVIEKVQKCR